MVIVLGATGHVGTAVMKALLRSGARVTAVTRDEHKAVDWRRRGAEAAVVDLADRGALRDVFRRGRRAFLLNPPAPPATDTDREEHRSFGHIVAALDGSGLEKLVVQSTYGAQPGAAVGDLSVLYDFEQALAAQEIPTTVLRAAYYMSNWDTMLEPARRGTLPTMYPEDLAIPMVAPADLGAVAARLLQRPPTETGLHHVDGPDRSTPREVAAAFAGALGSSVELDVTPRDRWQAAFRSQGFSAPAAAAYARMTAVSVDGGFDMPSAPERGPTTLQDHVDALVARRANRS